MLLTNLMLRRRNVRRGELNFSNNVGYDNEKLRLSGKKKYRNVMISFYQIHCFLDLYFPFNYDYLDFSLDILCRFLALKFHEIMTAYLE